MKILNKIENKNPLFSRNEVVLEIEHETVPSNVDSVQLVSKEFGADPALTRIRKIDSKFGSRNFKIVADIYDSKEEFSRVVKKTKQEIEAEKKAEEERIAKEKEEAEAKKAEEEAAKAEAEKPAEEEAPAEEKKEESSEEKVEEKKE